MTSKSLSGEAHACCARPIAVSNGFAAVLQQVDALPLGDGLWWLHSEQTVKRPGLAFVTPDKPMRYLGQPLNGLFLPGQPGRSPSGVA